MSIMSVRDMTPPRKEARGAGLGPRLTQLEALIREHRETSSEEDDLTVSDTLADHPIFRPCDQMLPYSIAAQATRIHLAPGEVLSTANGGPAYAVERGTVEVRVADGPPVLFGPGQVFNVVGFLGIAHEAEPFKPTGMDPTQVPLIKGHGGPYEIVQPAQVPRSLFAEKRGRQQLNVGPAPGQAQNGSRIGRYGPNASLGEVAVLGLVDSHPARVRAATDCRVLPVKASALSHALAMPNRRPEEREEINRLIEQRRSQVMEGIPMSALPIAISKEDVCSKAIALQADPTHLEPGGIWQPKADDSTAGPCFSVVTQGRALLEIASPNERLRRLGGDETPAVPVIPLEPGSLILEGIAAEFACRVRAISAVKVHRVRYVDFDIATRLESCSQDWLARFRMIENSTRRLLEDRGAAATGVVEALTDHAFKEDLEKYRERRKKALGVNFQQKLRSGGLVYDFSMMLPDRLGRMPHPAGDAFSKRAPCKIIARQLSAPAGLLSAAERRKLQAIQKWPRAYEHLSADFPDASGELLAEELWKSNGDKSAAEKKLREGPPAKAKRPSSQSRPLKLPLLSKSGASSAT